MAKMPPEIKKAMKAGIAKLLVRASGVNGMIYKLALQYGGQYLWNQYEKYVAKKKKESKEKK